MPVKRMSVVVRNDHLREQGGDPAVSRAASRPLRIFVPYTTPELSRAALFAAAALARDMRARVVFLAVHVVPYPLSLDHPDIQQECLLRRLRAVADGCPMPVRVELALAVLILAASILLFALAGIMADFAKNSSMNPPCDKKTLVADRGGETGAHTGSAGL